MKRTRTRVYDSLSLLVPDIMLAVQLEKPKPRTSEERLMAAVLEDALDMLRKHPLLRPSSADWILADDQAWPFSFVNICAVLNLNADCVRSALREKGLL